MNLPIISIFFFIVAISFIPSLFHAVSIEYTLIKMIEWLTYGLVLFIIPALFYKNSAKMIIYFSVAFTVFTCSFCSSLYRIQDGIYFLNEHLSGSGIRLAGFLQYPNATATIIGALILYLVLHYIQQTETKNMADCSIQYSTIVKFFIFHDRVTRCMVDLCGLFCARYIFNRT